MSAYNPPVENVPIFDASLFRTTNSSTSGFLTQAEANRLYLQYPFGQGTETIPALNVSGNQTTTGNILMNGVSGTNYLQFPDGSKQYGALGTLTPSPAGSYTNLNATINAYGQVITASNGTGGITSFTITSNAVGTNNWTFTIPNSYGRCFSYSVYSDTTPTTASKNITGSSPYNYGQPALNGSFFLITGNAVYQPFSGTSPAFIDYCSGAQNTHTITATGAGYVPSIINSCGATATWTLPTSSFTSTSTSSGASPCPSVATPSTITQSYTLSITGSVASCYLKLVGIVIAS